MGLFWLTVTIVLLVVSAIAIFFWALSDAETSNQQSPSTEPRSVPSEADNTDPITVEDARKSLAEIRGRMRVFTLLVEMEAEYASMAEHEKKSEYGQQLRFLIDDASSYLKREGNVQIATTRGK